MAHQHEVQLTPLPLARSATIQQVRRPGHGLGAFVRRFPVGCIGAFVLVFVAVLAVAAPLVSRYDPTHVQLRERKALPSWSHPLGTDYEGRDILTRLMYGGRVSLAVSILAVVLGTTVGAFWGVSSYNKLVSLDQAVQAQWSQVENVYQRRADLIPNLVETVKGAAKFEKETFTAVTEARAKVGQVQNNTSPNDPASVERFKEAQDQLSGALSKLLVVVERYPDLKATQAFRDLQVQLEGAENRIAVERMRYVQAAQAFNSARNTFRTAPWR